MTDAPGSLDFNSAVSQQCVETRGHLPLPEIAARLNARIGNLARELLGEPNRALSTTSQLRYGTKGSLAIETGGPEAGKWFDHEAATGGAGLELIRHHLGLDEKAARNWARNWLGEPAAEPSWTATPAAPASGSAELSEPTDKERAAKVAEIVRCSESLVSTPVLTYLRNRGITITPPDCIRYRQFAFGKFGAMVALATDEAGAVLALQQVYLTKDGQKAPLDIVKRTNKAVDGWATKAAVRLPGREPQILCEGVETALSVWQATGQQSWACLGIANIGRAPVPEGAAIVIARDGDAPGSKADRQIAKAAQRLTAKGHVVSIATPPEDQDFNDVLVRQGADAVRTLIDCAEPVTIMDGETGPKQLCVGSDVGIAGRVREDLTGRFGRIVRAEGAFWRFTGTHWEPIPDHVLRIAVHAYDGATFWTPTGEPSCVKLGKSRIDSALNECATLCAEPAFFETRPTGINSAAGLVRFHTDGTTTIEPHHHEQRCRHTLPGRWQPGADGRPPEGSLLARLLGGVFKGDAEADEKVALLSQVCGAAALGYATRLMQPRAVILFGQTAETGKSQFLDLARGLLPASAICSVPAARMGDERHVVALVNASDELSAAAVASDTFKSIVTGEPVQGRDVYKSRVEFRSMAQNLFATNNLPAFQGGLDRGVQRRLLVVPFNRTIPIEERIENIGRRIAAEEADLLLAWAVEGAARLIRQRNFTLPASCKQALADWILGADPVLAWLEECTEVRPIVYGYPTLATRSAYEQFRAWAITEGFKADKLPAINGFVQRVQANVPGIEHKRTRSGRLFLGLVVVRHASPD